MKKSEGDSVHKQTQVDQDHLKIVQFYREKMNLQPLHSALRSFNVQDGARMSGVYEICRNNEVKFLLSSTKSKSRPKRLGLSSCGAAKRIFDRSNIRTFIGDVFRSHGTKLTVRKVERLAVQKLER